VTANDTAPAAPRGWYPHPDMASTERYWNGTAWTGEVRPWLPPPSPPPAAPPPASQQAASIHAVRGGYAVAVLVSLVGLVLGRFPIVGFLPVLIYAIVLACRKRVLHGLLVILIAVVSAAVSAVYYAY
jgi:hypothetical protein